MSAELRPFAFEDHLVRVVLRDDDPWFVAKDVCTVLGIKDVSDACVKLDEDEKGTGSIPTLGGEQGLLIVSESGLYTIVLRSRAATTPGSVAHRFRRWVTAEVLPAIRRAGHYEMPPRVEEGDADEHAALGPLSDVSVRARLVEIAERLSGKPAARALWRRLGLPWVDEMEEDAGAAAIRPEGDDAVARFAIDGVERAPGIATPSPVLWRAFAAFCASAGLTNPGEGAFYRRFSRMGFSRGKSSGNRVYHGIRPARAAERTPGATN